MQENNYTLATIRFYESGWNKIQCFLMQKYRNSEYDMERELKYLENRYGFITKYNDGTLSQQRVQLLRIVYSLETDSLSPMRKASLEMKAERSSGRGMDLPAGRNGVPALSAGVRIRQV